MVPDAMAARTSSMPHDPVKQFSVFAENRVGRLYDLTSLLKDNNVHIMAITVLDTTDSSIIRVVVDDPSKARELLISNDLPYGECNVLAVEIGDESELRGVLSALLEAEINTHYVYSFIKRPADRSALAISAEDQDTAAQALAAAFDVVVIETVGVGQAETEVADVADTVLVVVQPGSGDVLQFYKSGIMETPDVLVVTKADLGQIALATMRDLSAALRSLGTQGASPTRVLAVSSLSPPKGIEELVAALDDHRRQLDVIARRLRARRAGAVLDFAEEHGERGLRAVGGRRAAERLLGEQNPGLDTRALVSVLERTAEVS